jgi:nitrogen-specific signal transduction histidine kinase/ActR/RegA family two-component response regulator
MDEKVRFCGVVHVVRDITYRKRFEKEQQELHSRLAQAQKMEAIGTLAGGIAHDFNNILSAIMGYTQLASLIIPEDSEARPRLDQVLKASRRAKDLVTQILSFGRQTEQERQSVQIGLIVKEAVKLFRSTLPATIEIKENIESQGMVEGDPSQIHQIVMNLCTNAYHAMREKGGVLSIFLEEVDLDTPFQLNGQDLQPGGYLKLTVSDTGHGIPREIRRRIFEPYFTTKEKGDGTGLGLTMVHGVVKNHCGALTLESELGKGTTFYIYLPRMKAPRKVKKTDTDESLVTGHERILFVDDEPQMTEMGEEMLKYLGYEITSQNSSTEALELFRANPDNFDMVITDMTMPKMTGEDLAREMMKIRPDIPIILCTGYSEKMNEEKASAMGISKLIMKPFTVEDLAKIIRKVMDRN